jgi:hypothetical protein
MMGRGIIRIQLDGAAELLLCGLPIPIVVLDDQSQCGMGFRQVVINFQRPQRSCTRLRYELCLRALAVAAHQGVAIGQSGICASIVWIFSGGLLKIPDCFL